MPGLRRSFLADTGPIVAIIRADDTHHAWAKAIGQAYTGKLIATWPLIAQAARPLGGASLVAIGERLAFWM